MSNRICLNLDSSARYNGHSRSVAQYRTLRDAAKRFKRHLDAHARTRHAANGKVKSDRQYQKLQERMAVAHRRRVDLFEVLPAEVQAELRREEAATIPHQAFQAFEVLFDADHYRGVRQSFRQVVRRALRYANLSEKGVDATTAQAVQKIFHDYINYILAFWTEMVSETELTKEKSRVGMEIVALLEPVCGPVTARQFKSLVERLPGTIQESMLELSGRVSGAVD